MTDQAKDKDKRWDSAEIERRWNEAVAARLPEQWRKERTQS